MIPPPKQPPVEEAPLSEWEKMHIDVLRIDSLTTVEIYCKPFVDYLLNSKVRANEIEIDIKRMVHYFQAGKGQPLTEFMCRRLIKKYEHDFFKWCYFIIRNGDDDWKESDKFRATLVQERLEGVVE